MAIAQKRVQREMEQAACHAMSHFLRKVPGLLLALKNSTARKISGNLLYFLSPRVLQVRLRLPKPRAGGTIVESPISCR
jgi:hypothetical protein